MKNRCTDSNCRASLPEGATRCPKCRRKTGRAPTRMKERTFRHVSMPAELDLIVTKAYLELFQAGEWAKAAMQLSRDNPKRPNLLWIRDKHDILWSGHGIGENDHAKL